MSISRYHTQLTDRHRPQDLLRVRVAPGMCVGADILVEQDE